MQDSFLIPDFGLTLDANINMQQIHLDIDTALSYVANGDKSTVKSDYSGCKHFMQERAEEIRSFGEIKPITIYIDKEIHLIHYCDIYIYQQLGKKKIPVRVITYKDYRYLSVVAPEIYEEVKNLPDNNFYKYFDEIDMSPFFITDNGKKREILQEKANRFSINTEHNTPLTLSKMQIRPENVNIILPYFFNSVIYDILNDKVVKDICEFPYLPAQYEKYGVTKEQPAGAMLHWMLIGDMPFVREVDEDLREISEYEMVSEENPNFAQFSFIDSSYQRIDIEKTKELLDQVGANLVVFDDWRPDLLVGKVNLNNDLLNKENLKIIHLRKKKDAKHLHKTNRAVQFTVQTLL